MADWKKFWEEMDKAIPDEVILQDDNVFGDYLDGQYVVQRANQICRKCGLSWRIDWASVKVRYPDNLPNTTFIKEMTGDLVVTDGEHVERRPACGLGIAFSQEVRPKQMDTACKGALTDLIKNGWMRFGRHLGGQLYFGKNPHLAEALGWEVSRQQRQPRQDITPADLGSYRIRASGWGKDRKFGGMKLEEVYEDPDGYGAMAWAAGLGDASGDTKKMAQYFNLRQQQQEEAEGVVSIPDGMTMEEYDESVTTASPADRTVPGSPTVLIASKTVSAKDTLSPEWANYVMGRARNVTGPGKLFKHNAHFINHLKSHYNQAKVIDLTGEQAEALVRYIESGGKDADSRWYAEPGGPTPTEELFGPESIEDLLKRAAEYLPEAWQDRPEQWWKRLREQYSISTAELKPKQKQGARTLLLAVASGGINWEDKESDTFKSFEKAVRGIAEDG